MRVAVAQHKMIRGVESPGYRSCTYDWREERGSEGNSAGVKAAFEVMDLRGALAKHYATDSHLTTYVVTKDGEPLEWQPRVNKGGVAWVRDQGYEVRAGVLMADVDNPGHAPWDDELRATFDAMWIDPPDVLATCGVYITAHGYRLIQPLNEAVDVEVAEQLTRGWLQELSATGIEPDHACADWSRLFRLPNVRRSGRPYVSPFLDLSRMTPRADLTPVPKAAPARSGHVHPGSPSPFNMHPAARRSGAMPSSTRSLAYPRGIATPARCP